MKVTLRDRGQGKTTGLVKRSAETGAYIVCINVDFVIRIARELGLKIPYPLTYDEYSSNRYSVRIHVLIDDADRYLNYLSRCVIDEITLSNEE